MEAASKKVTVLPIELEPGDEAAAGQQRVPVTYDSLHDLISPANQVCSLAGLLIKQYGNRLGPEAEVMFGLIQGSMNRLQNLLAGFRKYAQIVGQAGPYQTCEGAALLAGSLASLQRSLAESRVAVTYDNLPELHCDPAQISHVLEALLENSIKFRSEDRPEVHVSAISDNGMWVLAVRDNGIGIDPKYHKRIFEIFMRVHNDRYPGAGVGLAIANQIVQRHGGRMWVESELGQGATFFFSLPRAERSRPEAVVA